MIVYNPNSILYYRQHNDNAVAYGEHITLYKKIKRLIDSISTNERYNQINEAYEIHRDFLDEEVIGKIMKFILYKKNFINRLQLCFSKSVLDDIKGKRILFFLSILLGIF